MPEFRYIKLGEDIKSAVFEEIKNDTWLIYPTERSCREALSAFQKNRQPLSAGFLSMDEFKRKVICSDKIRLQDEKRLVCLYQAMTAEDRAYFHIEKYPDLIDWGQHFFELWEELAEECVEVEELLNRILNNEFSYQVWQLENFERILAVRRQYEQFISARGYTDFIFDQHISNLHAPADVRCYVFVNQYYYTHLERAVIEQLEKIKMQVVICYQGNADWLDEQSLKSRGFALEEVLPEDGLPFKLRIFQSPNTWQMALSFLLNQSGEAASDADRHFIIDSRFAQQPYHKVFDPKRFELTQPQFMHRTRLSHFLQIMSEGLQNLLTADSRQLIRLDWLLQAVGMDGFIAYFRPDWEERQRDRFIAFVCRFSDNDVLYLDTALEIIKLKPFTGAEPEWVDLLKEILVLLNTMSQIKSIRELVDMIDRPDGIVIKRLLSSEERECSNLPEAFYEALANFMSMDELALVDDWQVLYPSSAVSAGILDLLMSFIKPRTYRFYHQESANPSAAITNLMDTRNLQAEKVTFLNLVEGELPGGREAVWLFNEKQRKAIGLKTWEDIRNWERYYFYRLLAAAQEVNIYTVSSQEKDIEPSSFISELRHFNAGRKTTENPEPEQSEIAAPTLLANWLRTEQQNPLSDEVSASIINSGIFFRIPFDRAADFSEAKQISLSWSGCEHFIKNPFLYYLRDLKKLKERIVRQEETMGRKMFGILLHKYLNVITSRLAEQHEGILSMKWEWINKKFLANNLKAALADPLLLYQIPGNYNRDYLNELMTPFLEETASWFFHVGLAQEDDLKKQFITLIPETDDMTDLERRYKLLIKPEENAHKLGIAIRGRADLRLETKTKRFIIDFKTGESDTLQLLFYMWFYYLIEQPGQRSNIRAAFYKLMDKQLEWLDYKAKPDPSLLVKKLNEALDNMVKNGFVPAATASQRKYYADITRADLMRGLPPEEETE